MHYYDNDTLVKTAYQIIFPVIKNLRILETLSNINFTDTKILSQFYDPFGPYRKYKITSPFFVQIGKEINNKAVYLISAAKDNVKIIFVGYSSIINKYSDKIVRKIIQEIPVINLIKYENFEDNEEKIFLDFEKFLNEIDKNAKRLEEELIRGNRNEIYKIYNEIKTKFYTLENRKNLNTFN
ncbi:MAG: hypothetical protein B6U78_01015 [Candidatus Aenigmarchaeota archaeon ex4484_224]|nr:MAG: hypothetical protein B6U78_01015 [Candidatus Aenigmarchaeota archaeon ex4484_224]